jgi:hypothetical protein
MPLGKGISGLLSAVQDRIEVAGHGPTWRVTGGSFASALEFAQEAFDEPAVLARETSGRWWPRVTLTVTTDAALAATAPPLDELAHPPVPVQPGPARDAADPDHEPAFLVSLDEIFDRQEALRVAQHEALPRQRAAGG